MGSGMPEIGSRISLISKADIRYEGKLFAVDPEECTIALSSVRSYGTEDRPTTYPVPAQNQVYDFILFRGSDIKDIRVLTAAAPPASAPPATIPNDPAIVQLSVPPPSAGNHAAVLQFEAAMAGGGVRTLPSDASNIASRPATMMTQTFQNSGAKQAPAFGAVDQAAATVAAVVAGGGQRSSQNALLSDDESRASTPNAKHSSDAPGARATSAAGSAQSDDQPPSPQLQQRRQQTSYGYNRDVNTSQQQHYYQQTNNRYQQGSRQQYQQQRYQQNRYPSQQNQQQPQQRYQQQSQYRDYNNRDGNQYRSYNNEFGDGQRRYLQPLRGNVQGGSGGGSGQNWSYNSGGGGNNNNNGGNNYGQRWSNRTGQFGAGPNQQYQNRKPRNTLKFEDDYDFEQANSQFEEMRSQLAKAKIEDGPDGTVVNGGGDAEVASKEVGENEVSAGSGGSAADETEQPVEGGGGGDGQSAHCYDKVKSFFDQISYEAIERSKGLTRRMDWKTERKINSDTFGQVALRNNGNYRGRMNNGGGYYHNYRNNNNNNNNYNNNRNGGGMQNNYRMGGYNNRYSQNNQRRQYGSPASNPEESKENQIVVA